METFSLAITTQKHLLFVVSRFFIARFVGLRLCPHSYLTLNKAKIINFELLDIFCVNENVTFPVGNL